MHFNKNKNTIGIPNLLIPKSSVDYSKWAVVACDQFTSQPHYWKELSTYIGDSPSSNHIILPEVYLDHIDNQMIDSINRKMYQYINEGILEDLGPTLLLIERTTSLNNKRIGLIFQRK